MVNPNSNQEINKILDKAKEEGEVFLATLTSEELKRTGFSSTWGHDDDEFFKNFSYVDIYVLYDDAEGYRIKYVFDGDPSDSVYEYEEELGEKLFREVIESYLSL
jgi:hypothetical protein